jgi:thiol-disulfide isomerase/thioredoxin
MLNQLKIHIQICLTLTILLTGCKKNVAISLETRKISLEYSDYLATQLGNIGLVDITKLEPREEIESFDLRGSRIPSSLYFGQIVLMDVNRNNSFIDESIDFIGFGNMKGKVDFEKINFIKYKQPLLVKICHEQFSLEVDENGSNIELLKIESSTNDYDLTYPYKLPEREVLDLDGNLTYFKNDNRYTFVEFWGTWCKPCIKLIPELKSLNKYHSDKLKLISINYGDKDLEIVQKVIKMKGMNWKQIVADEQLEKDFGNPKFVPCGILFDPDGYLVQYGILPNEVEEYIKKK